MLRVRLDVYRTEELCQVVVYIYHSTWAGFTLLILTWGQCEGLILGIGAERNFTPTSFFIAGNRRSSIFRMLMRVTTSRGAVGRRVELCTILNNFFY